MDTSSNTITDTALPANAPRITNAPSPAMAATTAIIS